MPVIELQRFPGTPKEYIEVPVGTFFYAWISEQVLHADVVIKRNGITLLPDDELNFPLEEMDRIQVFDQPKGVIGDILSPIFKVVGQVFSFLAPKPGVGAQAGTAEESPNNKLTGQTNIARLYKARPDIYGQVRCFPDLIQESLFEYQDNLKYVTEFMNVGIGKYSRESVRYSESNLGSMAGASFRFHEPGEVIPLINEGYGFDDVDGQELPGPNESEDFPVESATANTVISGVYAAGQISMKIVKQDEFDYFIDLSSPHSINIKINVSYISSSGIVTKNISVDANMFNTEKTSDGNGEYYEFYFDQLGGGDIGSLPADVTINNTLFVMNDNETLVIGPVFSPVPADEYWIHAQAQLGNGDYARFDVRYWKVDDSNNPISGFYVINLGLNNDDGMSKTKYSTFKIKPEQGAGRYAITFTRTNNSRDSSILKIEEVHAVRNLVNVSHANDTLVSVKVRATSNALGSRERKYNLLATRHTISYDLTSRSIDYRLRPSRSFADAVLHTWVVMGGQSERTIDLYQLYSIQQNLADQRLGYFDYTFDDEDDSLGARIQTICNAASVYCYWDDGVMTFTRDERVAYPSAVFNRANIMPDEYKISYDMSMPGGYDGVSVEYVDPVKNTKTSIHYRVLNGQIIEQEAQNPNKITLTGCRNEYQARDRAIKEARRLIYSRVKMTARVFEDSNIQFGSVVKLTDIFDPDQQQGYLVGRNGNLFDTNEAITISDNSLVVITDSIGKPTQLTKANARNDTRFGFSADLPQVPLNIWNGSDIQLPSRFIICSNEEHKSALWRVAGIKPNSDGTTSLTLSEYSDDIYNYGVT